MSPRLHAIGDVASLSRRVHILIDSVARCLRGRLKHSGRRRLGRRDFGRDRVDPLLRDGEVHLAVGGEVRADVALVALPGFITCEPVEERADDSFDGQVGLFGDRAQRALVGPHSACSAGLSSEM